MVCVFNRLSNPSLFPAPFFVGGGQHFVEMCLQLCICAAQTDDDGLSPFQIFNPSLPGPIPWRMIYNITYIASFVGQFQLFGPWGKIWRHFYLPELSFLFRQAFIIADFQNQRQNIFPEICADFFLRSIGIFNCIVK